MQHTVANSLFPGYRRRLLGLLLLNPDEGLHGREIARRIGLPAGSVARELNRLVETGLLKREKRGNQSIYSADRRCPVFDEIAAILRKTSGAGDVLSQALEPLSEQIDVACIFGSFARGTQRPGSDIDVLVVGAADLGDVLDALRTAQDELKREISPNVFTAREWRTKLKAGNDFVKDVLAKPKIFLIGDKDDLAEPGGKESR